jgi:DNA invertase Pin-like site-specific DNA recombinase
VRDGDGQKRSFSSSDRHAVGAIGATPVEKESDEQESRLAMANVGYARVSKDEQNLDMQLFALRAAGCETIYEDVGVSAIAERRPGFESAVAALKPGDVFMIWKLDRAFRSLKQSIQALELFDKQGLAFRSLTEHIDTSTPMGQAMFQIQNVFSELERKLISERTKAGLEAARRNGKILGRPRRLSDASVAWAQDVLSNDVDPAICRVAESLNVSPKTLRRALRDRRQSINGAPVLSE